MPKKRAKKADGCRRCGECCMEMGSPPFLPRSRIDDDDYDEEIEEGEEATELCAEDLDFLEGTPQELIDEYMTYIRGVLDDTIESRGAQDLPCYWLDEETMLCKHYEFRPRICRQHSCWD
jgi:Fe-S-cluster containining protein